MTMYDMSRCAANGYFDYEKDAETLKAERMENRKKLNAQRTADYKAGKYTRAGGVVDDPSEFPQFVKDYYAYYKTGRGYHKRSPNSNAGWNAVGTMSFINQPLLCYISEIENPVLIVHGDKAHSRYFSETAFENMTGTKRSGWETISGNKELLIIPGASHIDLYDNVNCIPFDRLEDFFKTNLK